MMDTALLRQSKAMCPFLKKTSTATLRSLSTSTRHASPGGGSMSNLQTIARRCPIMGKAMAHQSAKSGKIGLGGVAAIGAVRAFTNKPSAGKARLHTSRTHAARAVEDTLFGRDNGMLGQLRGEYENYFVLTSYSFLPSACQACLPSPPENRKIQLRGILQCRA